MEVPKYSKEQLEQLFARGGIPDNKFRPDWEEKIYLIESGAKQVKRRLLGLCGLTTTKSLDDIARVLLITGIASSMEEARDIVPSLHGKSFCYGYSPIRRISEPLSESNIEFERVTDGDGRERYRVSHFYTSESE